MANPESISSQFGVFAGVKPEQTLSESFDPYSGIEITSSFSNTEFGFLGLNSDGRVPLGLFFYDENNFSQNNFPDIISNPKFKQVPTTNLIENGSGQAVKSFYTVQNEGDPIINGVVVDRSIFIPEGGWGYSRYDGVGVSDRLTNNSVDYSITDGHLIWDNDVGQNGDGVVDSSKYSNYHVIWSRGEYPDYVNRGGGEFGFDGDSSVNENYPIASYWQQSGTGAEDNQAGISTGYAGFYPYHTLLELQTKLRDQLTKLEDEDIQYNELCNEFVKEVMADRNGTNRFIPTVAFQGVSDGVVFPNFAHWSNFIEGASYGRALEFTATNYGAAVFDTNQDNTGEYVDFDGNGFGWHWGDSENSTYLNAIGQNQYRTLNQCIKIYDAFEQTRETELSPYTTMTVKFRMYTKFANPNGEMPEVETAVLDADGEVGHPQRIDIIGEFDNNYIHKGTDGFVATNPSDFGLDFWPYNDNIPAETMHFRGFGFPKNFHYAPFGDFHSLRYNDGLNDNGTLSHKSSNFGSMGRYKNSQIGKWETFSYTFSLNEAFNYDNKSLTVPPYSDGPDSSEPSYKNTLGKVRDLHFMIQAANEFLGTVYIDDIEVYQSGDFIPDVDVRKKISAGVYGEADLTKYYDKKIEPEKYKDTQGPLEAQFYFYPNYVTEKIFDQKRTPMYRDFQEGLFYLYDINWGDGTLNEFTSEPKQIDENTSVYHLYDTSGIFKITGTMLRLQKHLDGSIVGVISNKKFTLKINVNEGSDEDFNFFNTEGYAFIPYKNTVPMIGGYSKQSIYYKSLKRQLGYLIAGQDTLMDNIEENYTNINYTTLPSAVDALGNFNTPSPNGPPIQLITDDGVPLLLHYDNDTLNKFLYEQNQDGVTPGTLAVNEGNAFYTAKWTGTPLNGSWSLQTYNWIQGQQDEDYYNQSHTPSFYAGSFFKLIRNDVPIKITVNFASQGDRLKAELALLKMDNSFETEGFNEVLPEYMRQRTLASGEVIYNGLPGGELDNEIGKSVGDCDLTCIKYYNEPKSMYEVLGFEDEDAGIPNNPRYWKNIIPQDYSIFNRDIYTDNGLLINTYSEQEWFDNYYYPVLPRYGQDGKFIEGDFPNNNIPFPLEGSITNQNEGSKNLLINISTEEVESNVLNDTSGNQNLGFVFTDYKPIFDNQTFKPKRIKSLLNNLETKKTNGAF